MGLRSRFVGGLKALLHRRRVEDEMDAELREFLESSVEQKMRLGMSREAATRAARLELSGIDAVKDRMRDEGWESIVEACRQDVRYGVRALLRRPAFTIVAVASLALGIGANTAIFSLLDAVMLRMLPVHAPQELVEIGRPGGRTLSYPMYVFIRDHNDVFSSALTLNAGRYVASARLGDINAGDVRVSPVSGNYFTTLGVPPLVGRARWEADLSSSNVTVIGFQLWQRAFAGNPTVVDKTLSLGGRPYTIVGVAPEGFSGVAIGQPADLWVPLTWLDRPTLQNPVALTMRILARLKSGVSEEQARANLTVLASQWSAEWKFESPTPVDVGPGGGGLTQLRRLFSTPLLVLLAIVSLLLIMAATNVANLLFARASARQREIGVRLSLGASRSRLVRQLLTESALLGMAGGILGVMIASPTAAFLMRFLVAAVGPIDLSYHLSLRVLVFTGAISLASVLVFGLTPALAATRVHPSALLRSVSGSDRRRKGSARPKNSLIILQVAISSVLLVGAVLFTRSLLRLTTIDAGFQADHVLLLHVTTSSAVPAGAERVRLFERVSARLANVPDVQSTAFSSEMLFSGNSWTEPVSAPGFTPPPGDNRESVILVVSPAFFRTMNTVLLQGRDFNLRDDERGARVAIVNEAMARYVFGDGEAVGQTIRIEQSSFPEPLSIIGLVQDAKYRSLKEPAPRIVYLPALQTPSALSGANIAVQTTGDPERMRDVLWNEARAESAALRFGGATTQTRLVDATIAQDRMLAQLSRVFGFTAAFLICLGLYGLTTYDVSKRTVEIGVRIALGAQRSDVIRLVIGRSMLPVCLGLVTGLAVAMVLGRVIESLLFDVRSPDVVTLLVSATVLMAVSVAAAYVPARRAARLDPIRSLRYE